MIKKVLGLVGVTLLLATAPVMAEGLKIDGFVDIVTPIMSDLGDPALSDVEADFKLQTSADAEVDFEKTTGKVTVRLDVDSSDGVTLIEQAKFIVNNASSWFTGGKFNSPIGFEKQDAHDKLQITNGQLFEERPSNLSGFMLGTTVSVLTLNALFVNDWNADSLGGPNPGETDNSIGLTAAVALGGSSNLALGLLTSESATSGGLTNLVATTKVVPNLLLAFEYQKDDTYTGWGLTGNYTHGVHGVTVRYDSVDPEGPADASTLLTLAGSFAMLENLKTVLEWSTFDDGGPFDVSLLALQFVGKF